MTAAREQLAARYRRMAPAAVRQAALKLADVAAGSGPDAYAAGVAAHAALRDLRTRPDRYRLRPGVDARGMVQIIDRATGDAAVEVSAAGAERWLTWYRGEGTGTSYEGAGHDFRVCECRHLCLSHGTAGDGDLALEAGTGNGRCGVDDCGCGAFTLAIHAPAMLPG